jgi:hypothetical protein
MQLQYAHVLQKLLPLVCFNADESFEIDQLLTGLLKRQGAASSRRRDEVLPHVRRIGPAAQIDSGSCDVLDE